MSPLKWFKMQIISIENDHVEVTHNVFDKFTSILNHFRYHNQHLTHLILTLDILHRASRAYLISHSCTFLALKFAARFARNSSTVWTFQARYCLIPYHNFTQFCTFLASNFAARFSRNSSILYFLYISSSKLFNLRPAKRAYNYFTQFCTFLALTFAALFARNSSICCWYIYSSILLNL